MTAITMVKQGGGAPAAAGRIGSLLTEAWDGYRRDGARAAVCAEQARELARRSGDRVALVESLAVLSLSRNQAGDSEGAFDAAREAFGLLEGEPIPARVRMQALYSLGMAQAGLTHYDDARCHFEGALALARQCGDPEREADALADIAFMHHRQGDFLRALELLPQSLTLASEIGYPFGQAVALNRFGIAYDRIGDYGSAMEAHLKALALRRETGDRFGEMTSLNNLGNLHLQLGEFAQALACHEQSLTHSRAIGHLPQEAIVLGNIALSYQRLDDFPTAARYHRESLAIKDVLGDRQGTANTLGNLGALLVRMGEYAEAEDCLTRALETDREMGDLHGEAHCLLALGSLYEQGKAASGPDEERDLSNLGAALERAKGVASPELEYRVHEQFAKAYRARGDFARALFHFEEFHRIKEAVFTEQMATRTRMLQARHEVAQAKKETEIHRLRSVELTEALVEADRLREIAERLAREDALTGLLSRRYGEERLMDAFARAARYCRPLTVVLADVDHFKRINDTCSHQTGDAVLNTLGNLLRENCRTTDIIARYGGEEFLLALPETEGDVAWSLCERIRLAVERYNWGDLCIGLRVTLSLGLCDDVTVSDHEKMLSAADARLYVAKNTGRNRIVGG